MKNPLKFDTIEQYACAYAFVVCVFLATTCICRRLPLRIYYDHAKDTFSIISTSMVGRTVKTDVKAGLVKLDTSPVFRSLFGDATVLDELGRSRKRFRILENGFVTPWFYNHLFSSHTAGETAKAEYNHFFDAPASTAANRTDPDRSAGEDAAERSARLNAEKLEAMRNL